MTKLAKMTVWDVQLGLAVHVEAPNGKYIIIDLGVGTHKDSNSTFSPLLKRKNDDIGYMFITHPHLDHIDDIMNFEKNEPRILNTVKSISDKEVLSGVRETDKPKFQKYCDIKARYCHPVSENDDYNPKTSSNYGGLAIEHFQAFDCDSSNFNNHSTVIVLTLDNAKVVICGDNEKEALEELMKREDFKSAIKNAYVLVAPHHGRESGFHLDFVQQVNPYVTIISDKKDSNASAREKYTEHSRGYKSDYGTGKDETRYCLTTRGDGNIIVKFGEHSSANYSGTLDITVNQ